MHNIIQHYYCVCSPCCRVLQLPEPLPLVWIDPHCYQMIACCDLFPPEDGAYLKLTTRENCELKRMTNKQGVLLRKCTKWVCTQCWLREKLWRFIRRWTCAFLFFILQCADLHPWILTITAIQHLHITHTHINIYIYLYTRTHITINIYTHNRMGQTHKQA